MRLPIWQIDAFAEGPFRGNPAAVVLVEDWLPDTLMQAIAAENNQTTTAFLRRRDGGFALRWFTPTIEEPICGHATLATAALVLGEMLPDASSIGFTTPAGTLTVTRDQDGLYELDFPTRPPGPVEADPGLLPALGLPSREVLAGRDYLVICESAAEVESLAPDIAALARTDRHAIIVTGPGDGGYDCVSRFFAPGHGIAEDHATGAAHATVAPYWAQRLGKRVLKARQASPRGGVFRCTMREDGRVGLAGRCAFYLRGEIAV
ncbi:PhzF family phenazine biosynthesis protein [Roseomonas terrae]|jgi:PhzF family phenazine biosynthesis protein|uniref:PhzF family phenazine biosynthesis protein n=1 Tax=Neoroseomonas terrae TaxID=424799 RepID=A0ABS5EGC8_9PROT|nr:PhzF family phenazine biosynthesis protein [Neoroseomonas terrae]MBR0650063.1 PhzF family phenazine biosynthesis protein [Neoroseomonas terrae]